MYNFFNSNTYVEISKFRQLCPLCPSSYRRTSFEEKVPSESAVAVLGQPAVNSRVARRRHGHQQRQLFVDDGNMFSRRGLRP